jgi:hypothetical protein
LPPRKLSHWTFFFSRKEAKAIVSLTLSSGKPTLGVWGHAPKESDSMKISINLEESLYLTRAKPTEEEEGMRG